MADHSLFSRSRTATKLFLAAAPSASPCAALESFEHGPALPEKRSNSLHLAASSWLSAARACSNPARSLRNVDSMAAIRAREARLLPGKTLRLAALIATGGHQAQLSFDQAPKANCHLPIARGLFISPAHDAPSRTRPAARNYFDRDSEPGEVTLARAPSPHDGAASLLR